MKVVSAAEAVKVIHSGDTIVIGGSGGGHAVPEALLVALENRFVETQEPGNLTIAHPVGLGDEDYQGINRLAHPGFLKRVIGGSLVDSPALEKMALRDEFETYLLPQGALSQLMREMAAGRPGLITHTGLHTYADPRIGGCKQSPSAKEDLIEVINLAGREWMFYKPFPINVCLLRGTTADEDGNVTMEQEAVFGEMMSMAQATRRAGGVVIVQVKRLAQRNTLPAKQVKIPGMLVDLLVVDPEQQQTYTTAYNPAFAGELRIPLSDIPRLEMDPRKAVARRAAMELCPGAVCNLGAGISTGIANLGAEENFLDSIILTNEQGLIGGAPASGIDAGAATNYRAIVDQPYQFDFYDGGGLDIAFLSFAEFDEEGNVNISRFGEKIVGFGGFVNISQNAKKVVFSGTFRAGGLRIDYGSGTPRLVSEGRHGKLVKRVQQVSYSGAYGWSRAQKVMFITERAVFERVAEGVALVEIAPGFDLEKDILAQMDFRPIISPDLKLMDARLFRPEPVGLADIIARHPPILRSERLKIFA